MNESPVQEPLVILVNEQDEPQGTMAKQEAHIKGLCHRAFSVQLYRRNADNEVELLLQQRAHDKYHCGGLWTNTCCSHPKPGEETLAGAERRLEEECGIKVPLIEVDCFHYIATFENGLTENEVDHVFVGEFDGEGLAINPTEIAAIEWVTVSECQKRLQESPARFTPWFARVLEGVLSSIYKESVG